MLIEHPLGYVAVHIVEAPRIWFLACDLVIALASVLVEPGVVTQFLRIVSERVSRLGSSTACVFPFSFGRQAIIAPGFGREPLAKSPRRVLRHTNGREIALAHSEAHVGVRLRGLADLKHVG